MKLYLKQIFDKNYYKLRSNQADIEYSRFFTKWISKFNKKIDISEPFQNLFTQGMVCLETYKDTNGNF